MYPTKTSAFMNIWNPTLSNCGFAVMHVPVSAFGKQAWE
jgi:hypothetical protein